ncbi:MAG TPA: ATP-binding protein [Dissulfurispiraceae bacterium]|nr:ATP-binding protein [Dissulfurispiraceae bacterium]
MTIRRKLVLIFAFYVALTAVLGSLVFTELTALHESLKLSNGRDAADGRPDIIAAHAAIANAKNMLVAGAAIILVSGALVSVFLARSLVLPIRRLQDAARRMALGDLSAEIEISGDYEIASLCKSFNSMQIILKNVLDSLDGSLKELKEKQSQLINAEKLAAIGVFASGVAHEINNPLTSVLTFSNLLLEKMPEDDPRHEMLRIMSREAVRARDIVKQLLSFSRDAAIDPVSLDINETVRESLKIVSLQEALQGISVELKLAEDLPVIYADRIQIEEVLWNIISNAAHAITPPGVIGISTVRSDSGVEIAISDTGEGIPEEYLDKIFDPFFSTKGTAGTGLGLAVSYDIINKHGGIIDVASKVDEGTTFTIKLPANERDQGISS